MLTVPTENPYGQQSGTGPGEHCLLVLSCLGQEKHTQVVEIDKEDPVVCSQTTRSPDHKILGALQRYAGAIRERGPRLQDGRQALRSRLCVCA